MITHHLSGTTKANGTNSNSTHHPEPASHNRTLRTVICSWEGGEGGPGFCPREESQHRGKVVGARYTSSGNNQCLQWFKMVGWSYPRSRKNSAGREESFLRQLGELLDKAVDIVPVKYAWMHFGNPTYLASFNHNH